MATGSHHVHCTWKNRLEVNKLPVIHVYILFSKMSHVQNQNHSMKSWLVQLPWSCSMAYEIIPTKLRSILHYIKLVYYNMDYLSRDYYRFQAQLNTPGYNPWIRYIKAITSGPNWSLFQNLSVCFLFSGRLQTQPRRHSARHSQCARAKDCTTGRCKKWEKEGRLKWDILHWTLTSEIMEILVWG